jgi:hypothetical protein
VNSSESDESAAAVEVADHLLRFSRAFYEAFRIRHNRLRFWRMLFLLLKKEKEDGEGRIRDSFTNEEIQQVLGWKRPPEDPDRWRRQLIKQFGDDRDFFLKEDGTEPGTRDPALGVHRTRGRPPRTKIFRLSAHFETAAKAYVRGTASLVQRMPILNSELDRILDERGSDIFRKEIAVIGTHYFPPYGLLMDELVISVNAPRLAEAVKDRAPYWTIMLVAWRQHNQNPRRSFNRPEFETEVRAALRSVDKKEVQECFSFLIESKILELDQASADQGYLLNEKCMPALKRYTTTLKDAREHLSSLLVAELA